MSTSFMDVMDDSLPSRPLSPPPNYFNTCTTSSSPDLDQPMSTSECDDYMSLLDVGRIMSYDDFLSDVTSGRVRFDDGPRAPKRHAGGSEVGVGACFEGDSNPPLIIMNDVKVCQASASHIRFNVPPLPNILLPNNVTFYQPSTAHINSLSRTHITHDGVRSSLFEVFGGLGKSRIAWKLFLKPIWSTEGKDGVSVFGKHGTDRRREVRFRLVYAEFKSELSFWKDERFMRRFEMALEER